ncbi:MAG: N-acetyltransferase [Desulfovibrio sp.]|jgi:putative acetyltransferase
MQQDKGCKGLKATIRPAEPEDLDTLLDIWLRASKQAHHFVPGDFWESRLQDMRELYLPAAEVHVHMEGKKPTGFLALCENTLAALFVAPEAQGKGVGSALLRQAREQRSSLELTVYNENKRAVAFYTAQGFHLEEIRTDPHTGHEEYLMRWQQSLPEE